MVPVQEANKDNLGICFDFFHNNCIIIKQNNNNNKSASCIFMRRSLR